jgi:hypothetical protein
VTLSARGCRIVLATPRYPLTLVGAGSIVNESLPLTPVVRVSQAEYPIRISNRSPTPARVTVRRILGHEAPQFLRLWRWVPSLRS